MIGGSSSSRCGCPWSTARAGGCGRRRSRTPSSSHSRTRRARRDGSGSTAAWKTVTSQPRRTSSLAAKRGTIVPPPASFQPKAVISSLPLGGRAPAAPAAPPRGARSRAARPGSGRPRRSSARRAEQRLALAASGSSTASRPRARARAAARAHSDSPSARSTSSTSSASVDSSEKFVAVAAQADQRPARHVAEGERARGAQPEVEVLRERVGRVVAADGLVDAPVDQPRRVDQMVVRAQSASTTRRREVARVRRPRSRRPRR